MKNILLSILALLCIANLISGQSQRKALIEHFTQASCPPCAATNPIIDPIMDRNRDKVTRITHQVSWPGVDPMNKDNPADVQSRVSYYGVTGVPDVFLDAYDSGNPTATITDASIQNEYERPAPYEITISNTILPDYNSIQIDVTVKLTGSFTGKPFLRVAALEKIITWATPPGSNGEKVFYHVLKKFIPSATGTSISDVNQTGQTKSFSFIYKFDKLYDFRNLETAAFIQDDASKEVMQSENAAVIYTPSAGDDIAIKYSNAKGIYGDTIICGTSTTPIARIINIGNKSITSMDFSYNVNGGTASTFSWTGKLDYLKETDITLPAISFIPLKGSNSVNLEITSVNHVADFNPVNNVTAMSFVSAPSTTTTSSLELKQVLQPSALNFVIRDDKNQIVLQDGPFNNNTTKTYPLNLDPDRCYKLYTTNTSTSLNGTFRIYDNQNNLVMQDRVLGSGTVFRDFSTYAQITSTQEADNIQKYSVTPNPANQNITISYSTNKSETNSLRILNTAGKLVLSKELNSVSGFNVSQIDIQSLTEGIYFVSLYSGKGMKTTKLVVQ